MVYESNTSPVLVVVDVQQGMVDGGPGWGTRSTPDLIPNLKRLLKFWRSKKWSVFHVQHDDISPEEPDNPISAKFPETFAIHPAVAPQNGEKLFVKHTGSAFVNTDLFNTIKSLGGETRQIIIVGMDGAQCINSTTRTGADLGLRVAVVTDACASYGMEEWGTGGSKTGEETHRSAMSMLAGYAKLYTTETLLGILEETN
jgi:nicotinamidase-related amidase